MQPADAVLRFIESIAPRHDLHFWLKLFRAQAKERFATIVVEAPVLQHAFDAVLLDLQYLAALDLVPVVCLGLYHSDDVYENAQTLQQALGRRGVPSVVLRLEEGAEAVAEAVQVGSIPLVLFGAECGGDREARFAVLGKLVGELRSQKLIFLSRRGALSQAGQRISNINLTTEYDAILASPDLSERQRVLVQQAHRMVFERTQHGPSVAITSPFDLLRELFTQRGAGTFMRRGAVIARQPSFAGLDTERLSDVLAQAFGAAPQSEFFQRPVLNVYLEQNYRGVAITHDPGDVALGVYLSKFAVGRQAQGEGIGRDLWAQLVADAPVLFWRSRARNDINSWYAKECDGFHRTEAWHVFWRGLPPQQVGAAVAYALAQPDDIVPPPAE